MPTTRGFFRKRTREHDARLPPGQYDVGSGWPVLTAEATPRLRLEEWSLTVDGLVDRQATWSWEEINQLPGSSYTGDIHCVTTWSKFDVTFRGVSVDGCWPPPDRVRSTLLDGPLQHRLHHQPAALGCHWRQGVGGLGVRRKPLPREHGGPVRLPAPQRTSGTRKVDHSTRAVGRGPARVLGAERHHDVANPGAKRDQGDAYITTAWTTDASSPGAGHHEPGAAAHVRRGPAAPRRGSSTISGGAAPTTTPAARLTSRLRRQRPTREAPHPATPRGEAWSSSPTSPKSVTSSSSADRSDAGSPGTPEPPRSASWEVQEWSPR